MSKRSPGIVLVSKFVSGKSSAFGKYIDYINREEAVRTKHFEVFNINKLDGYNNYMGNPKKSNGIFTQNKSGLTKNEREELKKIFSIAQENDSIMWQDVVSFTNEWLEKNGLYNSETGWINEGAIQDSIRKGMALVLKEEGMEQSGVWSASIHFNTGNIHVHIALVEPYPTKPYKEFIDKKTGTEYTARIGNRKLKTLDKFKSKVANSLLERDKELAKISELIHKKIAPKTLKLKPSLDIKMLKTYNEIYKNLPSDTRLWKYNNNALAPLRPQINSVIDMYLKNNHPQDFKELDKILIEEMKFRESVYGTGDKNYKRYEDYRINKHNELYSKLGNAMLREMKEIRKDHLQKKIYINDLESTYNESIDKENIHNINNQSTKHFKEFIDNDNTTSNVKSSNEITIDNTILEKDSNIFSKQYKLINEKEIEKNPYTPNDPNYFTFDESIDKDNTNIPIKFEDINTENNNSQHNLKKGIFLINKSHLNKIKKGFDTDYQSIKNKQKYKQLEYEMEYE